MFPTFTQNNTVGCSEVYSILFCKPTLGTISGNIGPSYFQYLQISKLGLTVTLTSSLPAFIYHILGIIGGSPKKEVSRADAKRIITTGAVMTNGHTIWDFTKGKFPCPTVSGYAYGFTINLLDSIPVTILADAALPQPAIATGFINVTPKGFFCGNLTSMVTNSAAKFSVSVSDAVGFCKKGLAANLANAIVFISGNGIMRMHGNSPFRVMPPAASNSAGALCC